MNTIKKASTLQLIYSESKMEQLYKTALRILRECGCQIDHEQLRHLCEQRGMSVDHGNKRVFFTEELMNELLSPRPGKGDAEPIPEFPNKFGIEGSLPKYLDWSTKKSDYGNTKIFLEFLRTFGAMEQFNTVARVLTLSDIDSAYEPIFSTGLVIKHSPRPAMGEVYRADHIPYLIELGEIATGKTGCTDYVASCICIIPPLKITRGEGDFIVTKAKYNVPSMPTTMPSSGVTSPVTREGTIVIELAEVIAVWLCSRLVNPQVPLSALFASSTFDMRTGTCIFSSTEAVLQDCAAAQIIRHYFGVSAGVATNYVDAKFPGIQTTYEKLFKAFWTYQFLGYTIFVPGYLEAGQTFCAAQALLDVDMWTTANAFFADHHLASEAIPMDEIRRVLAEGGSFLDSNHTLNLFREAMHMPRYLDRSARESDGREIAKAAELLDRCQQHYEQVRDRAEEYTAPADICRAVDDVVERAQKAFL